MVKEIWVKGEDKAEIYRSSYRVGNRYSLAGRASSYKIRGVCLGVNDFDSKDGARKFLSERGFTKQ